MRLRLWWTALGARSRVNRNVIINEKRENGSRALPRPRRFHANLAADVEQDATGAAGPRGGAELAQRCRELVIVAIRQRVGRRRPAADAEAGLSPPAIAQAELVAALGPAWLSELTAAEREQAAADGGAALVAREDAVSHLQFLDMAVYNNNFVGEGERINGTPVDYKMPLAELAASKAALDELLEASGVAPPDAP